MKTKAQDLKPGDLVDLSEIIKKYSPEDSSTLEVATYELAEVTDPVVLEDIGPDYPAVVHTTLGTYAVAREELFQVYA